MIKSESALYKILQSISSHGVRAGLKDAAARWARNRLAVPGDVYQDFHWVLDENREATLPAPESGPLRLNWFVPTVAGVSGGLITIFRTIGELEKLGHQVRVYTVGERAIGGDRAKQLVEKNYSAVKADIEVFDGKAVDSDAIVATSWPTAYAARSVGNTSRKFYYVQDLEYLFYPEGSVCEFARQTYTWGFYGLTAGTWIGHVLQKEFGMESSAFSFSYDRAIYSINGPLRLPEGKKRVLFYARASTPRRGFELGVLALSLVSRAAPEIEFVLVGMPRESVQLPFPAICLENMPERELPALYRSCEVALVLSHTNLSLLPLELMACGCSVVSNKGPNAEWLLTEDAVQIAPAVPRSLADAILEVLHNEPLRKAKVRAGLQLASRTDWNTEIKKIEAALYRGLNVTSQQ